MRPTLPAATGLHCLACGSTSYEFWSRSTDAEYRTTDETFTYYRCRDCNVLFIDPVPRERLKEIYPPNYYSFVTPKRSLVHRAKDMLDQRLFRRILRGLPGSALRVLDVGGGAGKQLDLVKGLDARVSFTQVVDLDPAATKQAEQNGHAAFLGTIEEFQTDERFDLVLLLNLIEHVYDPGAVLAKVRGLLTPGGVALVKTPNYDSLDARLFRDRSWGGYHCPRHWVLFDRDSFVRLAGRHGLAVKEFRYTQGAPFWAQSVLFALDRARLVSITRDRPAMYHPLFPLFSAAFAAFDWARSFFGARTSQMFVVLGAEAAANSSAA
jgi:2-polyprenyl-3-methyl-5-hydroxy-6-metoxy-1,4-benzoquinol methylase